MELKEIKDKLESIYSEYYNGICSEEQLKSVLKSLYIKSSFSAGEWSELVLDAQWKNASDKDYFEKKIQIAQEADRGGDLFFCNCGGLLLVKEIEEYPETFNATEKLDFYRKCNAVCSKCGEEFKDLMFD